MTGIKVGDRVAYGLTIGSYAEYSIVSAGVVVPLPDSVSFENGAAAMIQGMTAHYLACSTYPLQPSDTCLIHAAAGGTGALLVQIAKIRGARVIGTVSSAEKEAIARESGADEVIRYTEKDFETEVKRLTDGKGVNVVYDSVGLTTFDKSLSCLRPRGYMVLFGQASGIVPPVDPQTLNQKGSLFLTRPVLGAYTLTREELLGRAADVFGWVAAGRLKIRPDKSFPPRPGPGCSRISGRAADERESVVDSVTKKELNHKGTKARRRKEKSCFLAVPLCLCDFVVGGPMTMKVESVALQIAEIARC